MRRTSPTTTALTTAGDHNGAPPEGAAVGQDDLGLELVAGRDDRSAHADLADLAGRDLERVVPALDRVVGDADQAQVDARRDRADAGALAGLGALADVEDLAAGDRRHGQ